VVDDHFMKVSHVMRADEWLSSTSRHVLLYRAFGWQLPIYAHLPMILGTDKSKLSKRHGATSVIEYRDAGYVPEAMVNSLALLGWALDDKTEIMGCDDLVKHFTIGRVSKTAAIFSQDKLYWMNGVHLRRIAENQGFEEFARRALPFLEKGLPGSVARPIDREYVNRIGPLVFERVSILSELPEKAAFFFLDELDYDAGLLLAKGVDKEIALSSLKGCLRRLRDAAFSHDSIEGTMRALAEEAGLQAGTLFGLVRVAVTGRTAAPPLFETMVVLGRERCLRRIEAAIARLEGSAKL